MLPWGADFAGLESLNGAANYPLQTPRIPERRYTALLDLSKEAKCYLRSYSCLSKGQLRVPLV